MNQTFRFVIAGVLTLLLVVGAVTAWAGPARRGTVPLPPDGGEGECGDDFFWVGTATIKVEGTCEVEIHVYHEDHEDDMTELEDKYSKIPSDKKLLTDVVEVNVTSGEAESITACFAYPPETEQQKPEINHFTGGWLPESSKVVDGPPRELCSPHNETGAYALLADK